MKRAHFPLNHPSLTRREMLVGSASAVAFFAASSRRAAVAQDNPAAAARTVLGPVSPTDLGVALMHEHAPTVDWSELYETQPAPFGAVRDQMLDRTAALLDAFHGTLADSEGPGAIVEATPVRVGRYPRVMVDLAKRTKVHIIAATGFWCEAMAPQHPWAVRMSVKDGGVDEMEHFFAREITEGMEDPAGQWGEKFTAIKAGIIKIGTSTYLRPSERIVHIAAAKASQSTGCPITTHTTNGGGLEEAELLLKEGASPERVIIGHQGHQDDRANDEAHEYHRLVARLGCYVQFDRVGGENYPVDKQSRLIVKMIEAGFLKQVLVGHDHVPYFVPGYVAQKKTSDAWTAGEPDFTTITTKLRASLARMGVSKSEIHTMLVENPARVLAF
jgi:predicted metal-dependent phosphotriesterase family hydrolase